MNERILFASDHTDPDRKNNNKNNGKKARKLIKNTQYNSMPTE